MRITFFLLLASILQTFANDAYSQNTRLSLNISNTRLADVLDEIEENSEFFFLYNEKLVETNREVSVSFENKKINEILDELFEGTNLEYKISDRKIIIAPEYLFEDSQQKKTVSGVITDEFGEPLPGVTILLKGSTKGAISDINGKYYISDIEPENILSFSFIGMLSQEIKVGDSNEIDVILKVDAIGIEEVVAIGYGTLKKSDLTGAVSSVNASDIEAFPTVNLTQALQGRLAGVEILSNNGGEPGNGMKVRIRGATSINANSSPLYVVDGLPGGIVPPAKDIESIDVLKDASATAIFGSRGANGVVVITTKRGKVGNAKIALNSSYSVQSEIKRFDLLNAQQFAELQNEIMVNSGYPEQQPFPNPSSLGQGTDWQDEVLRKGNTQNYQLTMSGGNESVKYYISGIYYNQDGIVIDNNYKQYSVTSNLDINASSKLNLGISMHASRSDSDNARTRSNGNGFDIISGALRMEPTQSIYNEDGTYARPVLIPGQDNPVAIAKELINDTKSDLFQGNFYGEYQFLPCLKFKSILGGHITNRRVGQYNPTTLFKGEIVNGEAIVQGAKSTNLNSENYFTFDKSLNNNNITVMAGYSYNFRQSESWQTNETGFITNSGYYWSIGSGTTPGTQLSSGISTSELSSYYGRLNYKLLDRYMLTFTARYDGSSRFAKNNKWAFFPSGAIAWNVAEESFMDNMNNISQLKIRASYGVTGSQAIGTYQSLARLQDKGKAVIDGNIVPSVFPIVLANNDLKWEKTAQTNIGFDLGLFDSRIQFTAEAYKKVTSDLLFYKNIPPYFGANSIISNIGSVENKGLDFSINTVNIQGALNWETRLNLSMNRNKVLELPNDNADILLNGGPSHINTGNIGILRVGESVGSLYGYVYDGVIQQGETVLPGNPEQEPGGEKFKDIAGSDEEGNQIMEPDGKIDSYDRTIIGNPHPDFIWGLSNYFEYKDFDLEIFVQGSQGNDIYGLSLLELNQMSGTNNSTTEALNRWKPNNTDTDIPMAKTRSPRSSSRFVYDGSYIRLKNISLGYNVPGKLVNKIGIGSVKVYVSAQNILTITDYPGMDPEVNYNSSNTRVGLDYGSYPNVKSVSFGCNIVF